MSDRLLEVISTRGEMPLDDFDGAFNRLVPQTDDEDQSFARNNTLYALDALGHCEKDWSRQRLFACRPVLARLPSAGCPRVVLTGARIANTVAAIKMYADTHSDVASFSITIQSDGLPDVITLEAADETTLAKCATTCRLPLSGEFPAAWTLANASGCLADYEARLTWKPDASLNWRMRVFDPSAAYFRRYDDPLVSNLLNNMPRLTEHINPITQERNCRWTKEGYYALIARDWGRWLALNRYKISVLLYDARRQRLASPSSVPLPRLLARAATLCSGRAPYTDRSSRYNVYESVPATLAELIALKCGQSCKSANLGREADHA